MKKTSHSGQRRYIHRTIGGRALEGLAAMGRFHCYSFGNTLEIAHQKPTVTRVAGMYAWDQLGRKVKKGKKGIRILAPVLDIRRRKGTEASDYPLVTHRPVLVGFHAAYVLNAAQTDGAKLPLFPGLGRRRPVPVAAGRVPRRPRHRA